MRSSSSHLRRHICSAYPCTSPRPTAQHPQPLFLAIAFPWRVLRILDVNLSTRPSAPPSILPPPHLHPGRAHLKPTKLISQNTSHAAALAPDIPTLSPACESQAPKNHFKQFLSVIQLNYTASSRPVHPMLLLSARKPLPAPAQHAKARTTAASATTL